MAITMTDIIAMQTAMDILSQWAQRNDLKINEDKTALLIFRKGGRKVSSLKTCLIRKVKILGTPL